MKQPSFLARKTFGQHNYLLLAIAAAFLVLFIPRGARRAIESNTNKAEDWLPRNYAESVDLRWFRDHFIGEQFALMSWEGCTLGDPEKLNQLVRSLMPSESALARAGEDSELAQRARWYKRVITGPEVLDQLTSPPLGLDYGDAVKRLEGALVGPVRRDAEGKSLGNQSRTTCLVVFLSKEATRDNKTMRTAIERISEIASTECAIDPKTIHMGGPPVDNITIDIEGEKTLFRLAGLSGIVGLGLSFWCLRSVKLTGIVFATGVISAGMSLAIVFYFGIVEVLATGLASPRLGTVDAILMSMPAVVYVLGLSGAIHIVNYYRDARRDDGLEGAAETAVAHAWVPCSLAAFTTAVGLGSLYTSDILPIKKFGMFTAIGVMATVAILFTILPVFLHCFPISDDLVRRQGGKEESHLPGWARSLFGFVVRRHALVCVFWLAVMGLFAFGVTKIETKVQLLELLDEDTDLIHDYAWLEKHIGNLVPMEIIFTVPPERCRTADEHAEADGKQYRLTMLERLDMMRVIQHRIEVLPEISRVLSVATFTPKTTQTSISAANSGANYAKNKSLEENRDLLLDGDYLRLEEVSESSEQKTGRELWRVSARVAALSDDDGNSVDYGEFVQDLRMVVDPVLLAYQQRDRIVQQLHEAGKKLDGARLCILFRNSNDVATPDQKTQEWELATLLRRSGVTAKGISYYNLAKFSSHKSDDTYRDGVISALTEQDALILVSAGSDPMAGQLAAGGLLVVDVSNIPLIEETAASELATGAGPRPIRAVYTGMIPLVYKTQRQLLISLRESIGWATVLIAVVMMLVLRSPMAGFVSMVPNVFPIIIVFGALGWVGMEVDIGIMMTASVALGVAVDDTIHYLTWFRRGMQQGLSRDGAVMLAYDRCATAMTQTTIIGGLGLAVFATSTFTPTQQFGYLMITMLATALVGDLLLLPAILASPLGRFFAGPWVPANGANNAGASEDDRCSCQPVQETAVTAPSSDLSGVSDPSEPPGTDGTEKLDCELIAPTPISPEEQQELSEGPHAALHAKLRSLRREHSSDPMSQ